MGEMLVMTKIFVGTLFIVALINKRDQYHQKALQLNITHSLLNNGIRINNL